MPDNMEILKLRLLISFLKMSPESCTVTKLAKTLGEEKYSVSRGMIALGKEGLLDRSSPRHPELTVRGKAIAGKYAERMDVAVNHLIYEGVGITEARQDATYLSLYCSDETFRAIRGMEERCRIKYELRGRRSFDGMVLCRNLRDGSYQFPFIIYRENVKDKQNISMANEGFAHPCELIVKKDTGTIRLRAVPFTRSSPDGKSMQAKISSLKYYDGQKFCDAEKNGDFMQFPAQVLNFVNIGDDQGQVLHGSVCLKMASSAGPGRMPESTAIFTVLI